MTIITLGFFLSHPTDITDTLDVSRPLTGRRMLTAGCKSLRMMHAGNEKHDSVCFCVVLLCVQVYPGTSDASGQPQHKICKSSTTQHSVTTTGNDMLVVFNSGTMNSVANKHGFTATYSSLEGGECFNAV